MNREFSDVQAGFRKGRGTRDQIANIRWIIEKQESSRKTSISALLTMPNPLTVWTTINCGKFWKRWEYQTTWPASWEICMQARKQQLELDMENNLVPNRNCHPAYLTYMQHTSWETLAWMKHKLESRLPGERAITSDMQWRGTKEPLDKSERGKWRSWLKAQHSENKYQSIWSHHFMGNR